MPWELGIAEAQQTLVLNDLRSRVVIECDGQLKTGRDVAIACLLGAEEFGFSTCTPSSLWMYYDESLPFEYMSCWYCYQDPELRKNFKGKPEHVINYMYFVAQEAKRNYG